jgi:hypothetical protein
MLQDTKRTATRLLALVESYRTATGPRQRVVAWLGKLDEAGRLGVQQAVDATRKAHESPSDAKRVQPLGCQLRFEFDDDAANTQPRWVEVNANGIRVENVRQFGGPWLALQLIRILQLDSFLEKVIPEGRELVPWDVTSLILVIARLLEPSSELFIAEQWYAKTAMPDLLGVPDQRIDDNRLYRALDQLLPHKEALEVHLKNRLGQLFHLEYDLLLYDVTSTYFEGAANFPLAHAAIRVISGVTASRFASAWWSRDAGCHLATRFSRETLPMSQPSRTSLREWNTVMGRAIVSGLWIAAWLARRILNFFARVVVATSLALQSRC